MMKRENGSLRAARLACMDMDEGLPRNQVFDRFLQYHAWIVRGTGFISAEDARRASRAIGFGHGW